MVPWGFLVGSVLRGADQGVARYQRTPCASPTSLMRGDPRWANLRGGSRWRDVHAGDLLRLRPGGFAQWPLRIFPVTQPRTQFQEPLSQHRHDVPPSGVRRRAIALVLPRLQFAPQDLSGGGL